MAFELPPLPYDYTALEPHIDEETMRLHHDKHHTAYTNNLNDALKGTEWEGKDIEEILQNLNSLPDDIRAKVRNNGGGYANHTLFWELMSPNGGGSPTGVLADDINAKFGSFDAFKEEFQKKAIGQFGSGWAWLCMTPAGELHLTSTANQDTPVMDGHTPLLGLDVWEHAYYKKYGPARADYAKAWWNVVDWNYVAKCYDACKGS
ncbi:MAG: superoxide dismutase [Ardenticatenales bacterium]|nr:superoxide dismutase [Ardenticatenales bacterium]